MNQALLELLETPPTRLLQWGRTDGVQDGNGLTYRLYDLGQTDPEAISDMQRTLRHIRIEAIDSVVLAERATRDLGVTVSPPDLAKVETWEELPTLAVLDYEPLIAALTVALQ